LVKGALIVGKRYAVSCPLFLKNSHKHVKELRQVVSIIGPECEDCLLQMSRNFWNNVFRYNYCESIPRLLTLPGFRKKIKEVLKSYGVDKAAVRREKRDLVTIGLIVVGAGIVITVHILALWLYHASKFEVDTSLI